MSKNTELALSVSQEELLYLVTLMNQTIIPGLDPTAFEGVTEREMNLLLGIAERALIARGFILPGEKGMQMDEVPLAMIGACAYPAFSVILNLAAQQAAYGLFWHGIKNLTVEHTTPMPGIHKFRAVPSDAVLTEEIIQKTGSPDKSSKKTLTGTVSDEAYIEAQALIQEKADLKKAAKSLKKGGLEEENAAALAEAIQSTERSIQAGFIQHHSQNGAEADIAGGTAVFSPNAGFLITPIENDRLDIQPLNAAAWKKWLQNNLKKIIG